MPKHNCRDDRTGRFRKLYFDPIAPSRFNIGDKVFVADTQTGECRDMEVTQVMRHQNNNLIPIISYNLVSRIGVYEICRVEKVDECRVFATELEALRYLLKEIIPYELQHLKYKQKCLKEKAVKYTERIKELEREKRRSKYEDSKHTRILSGRSE